LSKKAIIKLYNTLSLPALLHGSETWTIKTRDARRITAGYTGTDHKTNTQIEKELNITTDLDKIQEYNRNLIQHVNRMRRNRFPRILKNGTPKGRRTWERPLKRLLDK
jgi:hypothetical protein